MSKSSSLCACPKRKRQNYCFTQIRTSLSPGALCWKNIGKRMTHWRQHLQHLLRNSKRWPKLRMTWSSKCDETRSAGRFSTTAANPGPTLSIENPLPHFRTQPGIARPRGGDPTSIRQCFIPAKHIFHTCGAPCPTKSPALWAVWRCLSHITLRCVGAGAMGCSPRWQYQRPTRHDKRRRSALCPNRKAITLQSRARTTHLAETDVPIAACISLSPPRPARLKTTAKDVAPSFDSPYTPLTGQGYAMRAPHLCSAKLTRRGPAMSVGRPIRLHPKSKGKCHGC